MSPHNFEIKRTIDLSEVMTCVLCDSLHYIGVYGLDVTYDKKVYADVAGRMTVSNRCWEDVLVQMLIEGNAITFVDTEADDEGMTSDLTLEKIQQTITDLYGKNEEFSNSLDSIIREDYDFTTSDALLQFFLYNEIVFG